MTNPKTDRSRRETGQMHRAADPKANRSAKRERRRLSFTPGQTGLLMGAALITGTMLSSAYARPKFSAEYFLSLIHI